MNVQTIDTRVNELILSGKAIEAFDEFYADDVVMQENSEAPFVGKALNRKRELEFFGSIEEFFGATLVASAVNGDTSLSQWSWDLSFVGVGRVEMNQVAVRTWKDGKIVHERFFYAK
ncbi:MAG: polyketide cyclase [Deltaproteobacteria bacterium HGW-Deltaproteobacteria-14]|jgi:ketosteroid isomerase-like protein|nr:MAG: polyketide cyclase [Deltaproteobacteria bacterium HGW-Deltaproteobacteria-14]